MRLWYSKLEYEYMKLPTRRMHIAFELQAPLAIFPLGIKFVQSV